MFSYCFKSFVVDFKASLQPVNVFKHQAEEEKGETVRLVCMYNLAYVIYCCTKLGTCLPICFYCKVLYF